MSRRHRRRGNRHHNHRSFRGSSRQFQRRRKSGWGMNIYRNTREGKVAGVAAGLGDYWDVAPWVVRLMWVGAFIFTGTLALWLYIGAWLAMAPRPALSDAERFEPDALDYEPEETEMEYDERIQEYRPRRVFRYSQSSTVRLQRARERLDAALHRVEDMESYVTSRQYNLNKEFAKL